MNINEVLRDGRKNRGGTYFVTGYDQEGWHLETAKHDHGYYVSRQYGIENVPDLVLTRQVLSHFITARELHDNQFLGLWLDERGLWSVDVTEWYEWFDAAIDAAKRNEQRSIWHIIKLGYGYPIDIN